MKHPCGIEQSTQPAKEKVDGRGGHRKARADLCKMLDTVRTLIYCSLHIGSNRGVKTSDHGQCHRVWCGNLDGGWVHHPTIKQCSNTKPHESRDPLPCWEVSLLIRPGGLVRLLMESFCVSQILLRSGGRRQRWNGVANGIRAM